MKVVVYLVLVYVASIWLRVGVRRAKRTHHRWRVDHGWKCAHLRAEPGRDRVLDFLLAVMLIPLGPLVSRCRRQSVLVSVHLLLLLVFGTAPAVTYYPAQPSTTVIRPALHIYPITPGEEAPRQRL